MTDTPITKRMVEQNMWQSSPALACSICIADTGVHAKPAITIIRGYAVCVDHAELVGFTDEIVDRIKKHWEAERRAAKQAQEIKEKTVT